MSAKREKIDHASVGLPQGWSLAPNYHLLNAEGTDQGLILQEVEEKNGRKYVKCIVPGCLHVNDLGKDSVSRMRRKAEEFHLGGYKKKLKQCTTLSTTLGTSLAQQDVTGWGASRAGLLPAGHSKPKV